MSFAAWLSGLSSMILQVLPVTRQSAMQFEPERIALSQ